MSQAASLAQQRQLTETRSQDYFYERDRRGQTHFHELALLEAQATLQRQGNLYGSKPSKREGGAGWRATDDKRRRACSPQQGIENAGPATMTELQKLEEQLRNAGYTTDDLDEN